MTTRTVLIFLVLLLTSITAFGQFSKQIIKTDSSEIEIIRNSVYRVYEETYTKKDSIWYSVYFIKDTTQLHTEGWKRKNEQYLGVWKEYNIDKQLLYTWDYDNNICEVNKDLYPYHDVLEKMKLVCDSLIVSIYSKDFFDEHVRFEYHANAYNKGGYVGSWIEPMTDIPSSFLFRYKVRLNKSDQNSVELEIDLDSLGNYVPSSDFWSNKGFENVLSTEKSFTIDKSKAVETAKLKGLTISDTSEISEFLTWENFRKQTFYNGQFRYYITDFTGKEEYNNGEERRGIIYRYDVYTFNPWTGEFIEKKKMKTIREWEDESGFTTGLLPED